MALYGSAFDFKRIINIELTEKGKDITKKLVKRIGGGLDEQVSVLVGTFRDYFPVDAQVYVLPRCPLSPHALPCLRVQFDTIH